MNSNVLISCMGIVVYNNEVALLKNKLNNWVIPKGHMEENENYVETAIREVNEESSIVLTHDDLIGEVGEYTYYSEIEKHDKLIKVFLFKIKDKQEVIPQLEEDFIEGKWVLIDDAIDLVFHKEQKEILLKVKNIINDQEKKL